MLAFVPGCGPAARIRPVAISDPLQKEYPMKRLSMLVPIVLIALPVLADNHVSYKSTELAPGLYMLEGVGAFTGGNLGLWSGEDGVLLIDNGMPTFYDLMLNEIREFSDGTVDYLVNTHVHGDHLGNNDRFSQSGAVIIAHDNIRRRLEEQGITGPDGQQPAGKHVLPELTFADGVTLHLNGHRAHVIHVSHAHTDGDAIIHFPEADVIHAGDVMFNGLYPYIDMDSGGSVAGYIAAQEKILSLAGADTRIISGHGPLATKADLEAARDMLVDSRDRVRKLVADGKSDDEIHGMNPLADYDDDWSWGFIDTRRMTEQMLRDARATLSR